MSAATEIHIGSGIRVESLPAGGLVVRSPKLDLRWHPRQGRISGTAIRFHDRLVEVVDLERLPTGDRWVLRLWPENETIRNAMVLDEAAVANLAEQQADEDRAARLRAATALLLPLLGLLPGRMQRRWEVEWCFSAERATRWSCYLEAVFGGLGMVSVFAGAFSGEWLLPPLLSVPGPLLFAEGLARLAMCSSDGQPVGSILTAPIVLLLPAEHRARPGPILAPEVRRLDEERRLLEIYSSVMRPDWDLDGQLQYRELWYRLRRIETYGRGWLYRFGAEAEDDHLPLHNMSLRPPSSDVLEPGNRESFGFVRTALLSAAACLAPAVYQERWASRHGSRPLQFTVMGGGFEIVGGLVNLVQGVAGQDPFLRLLNLGLICEGLVRIGVAIGTQRPFGSVLGIPLKPLFERLLPDERVESGSAQQ